VTMENTDRAEVMGVSPLTIIEGVDTVVTLRGRNLILAYNEGLLALRCPSRATLRISKVDTSTEEGTDIETISFHVSVSASPPLEPLERIAVQVLASRRAGSQDDLVAESSKQMFTVLPANIPVPLAYSPGLNKDKPTMVMVLGRNLEGCTLEFGGDVEIHLQQSNERFLAGIVTVPEGMAESTTSTHVSVLDSICNSVAQYNLTIANSAELLRATPVVVPDQSYFEGSPRNNDKPFEGSLSIDFAPVSEQLFFGPTAEDSSVYDLRSESQSATESFIWINFQIVIADVYIILPIINEVYTVALFDGGGDEFESPILAQVGKLFPVRGLGILVAVRVEVTIHITVILIISIYFDIFDFGLFNEFSELFPEAIATVTVGLIVEIEVLITISFLNALVLPDGRMRLLFAFNLTIGIDFTISTDGRHLNFEPNFSHSIRFFGIHPFNEPLPCGGQFQLAADNGQTVFTDAFGGQQSFYFARSAGRCCTPWRFELELVRFSSGGNEEVIQSPFDAQICITAFASPNLMDVIITSVPPPEGVPLTLVMDIGDSATLLALAQPVDENGNPDGPLQDIRDLGYGVEFYLEEPLELLDPNTLPPGDAYAIQSGQNLIRAAVTSVRVVDEGPLYTFFPNSILGFDIIRFLAQGQPPRLRVGGLPVSVNPLASAIGVEPTLAYRDANSQLVATSEIERYESFETQRQYVLAVKLNVPAGTSFPQTIRFKVKRTQMSLSTSPSQEKPPLEIPDVQFGRNRRTAKDPQLFFTGTLSEVNQEFPITINSIPSTNDLIEVVGFNVVPNQLEVGPPATGNLTKLVPPGKNVGNRDVLLKITFDRPSSSTGASVSLRQSELKLKVVNDETFEEYLRVFVEAQEILTAPAVPSAKLRNFAENFYSELKNTLPSPPTPPTPPSPPPDALLITQGKDLWTKAVDFVQNTAKDDRVLYYIRLQSIAALRSHYRRNNIFTALSDAKLNMFEWSSRGLETTDGINASITFSSTNARKAIVTGFDPFGLTGEPKRSNPSGLIALHFNEQPVNVQNQDPVNVRTAIFPVRYKDFNNRIVENAITQSLGSIIMLITTSENAGINYYDVERWAGRFRVNGIDNDNKSRGSFPPDPAGPEYLESSLPYELVITAEEELESPVRSNPSDPTSPFTMAPFVMDQSYRIKGQTKFRETRRSTQSPAYPPLDLDKGKFRPEPIKSDPEGHTKITDATDKPIGISDEGSGSSYLSNEIFYRIALKRNAVRDKLASGHIHIPSTGLNPAPTSGPPPTQGTGGQLITGFTRALSRFFAYGFRFSVSGSTVFPATIINQSSPEQMLTITNNSTETLKINAVDVAAPFSVILPPPTPPNTDPLPITVNANSLVALPFKFTPTAAGVQTGKVTLRELSGETLLIFELRGEGIQSQPPPVITGFSPTTVYRGDLVTVTGQYFTRTTQVKIGNTNVNYRITSDTELQIEAEAISGKVTVVTLFGTVTNADILHIIFRPPPPDI